VHDLIFLTWTYYSAAENSMSAIFKEEAIAEKGTV